MDSFHLTIVGMTCGHCVARVQHALATLEGVTVETVRVGDAAVRYDPAVQSPRSIAGIVTHAGYDAEPAGSAA